MVLGVEGRLPARLTGRDYTGRCVNSPTSEADGSPAVWEQGTGWEAGGERSEMEEVRAGASGAWRVQVEGTNAALSSQGSDNMRA